MESLHWKNSIHILFLLFSLSLSLVMADYLEVLVYVCFSCILILFFLLFCIYGFLYIAHVEESENINLLARKSDTQQHLINKLTEANNTQAHQFSQLVSVVNRHMHSIVIHNNDNERPQFQPCTPSSVLDPRKHTSNGFTHWRTRKRRSERRRRRV